MSDYTVYSSRPDRDEAPAECQYADCDQEPTRWVKFLRPKEYVCYCRTHGERAEASMVNACRSARLT